MVNEVLYCERLFYLEWAQGEFTDNVFTVDGRAAHARADRPGGALPPPPTEGAPPPEVVTPEDEGRPYQARTVWITSERVGLTAKIDVVEGDEAGQVVPIEYKRGSAPDVPEGAYLPERAQLCAQVLLLRDRGYSCERGDIYFAGSRRRVSIVIDDALVETTLAAIARVRALAESATLPPPLVDSPKCNGCSLVGICLPDEVNLLRRLALPSGAGATHDGATTEQLELTDPKPLRRLIPTSDDSLPLYVQEQGARIGLDGDCIVVRSQKNPPVSARLVDTSHVAVYGNVQISAQAMRALLERGIQVSFLSYGGWYFGRATGFESKNIELRIAQHRAANDEAFCLRLARGFVATKIRNCRTLLRRNHAAPSLVVLSELEQHAKRSERATALESLLGIEGTAARTYFGAFGGMLKGAALSSDFDLDGRNRRPPRDPMNAVLSFVYSLLTKDVALAIGAVGLDPLLGFYHQPRFGRPSLALDLMEEFRPLIADSTVIGAINGGSLGPGDFLRHPTAVSLTAPGRKRLLLAYERRMEQEITHPVFGYRISYRRVLEVQARLLTRYLFGEIEDYPHFRTR
jgi:CRISPR-associated protein Cas1